MFKKTSKLLVPCAVFVLGSVTALFADNSNGSNSYADNCCKPCCVPTCCPPIPDVCAQVCPPTSEITPKAGPVVMGGSDMVITADFIYWEARQEGTEFASSSPSQSLSATSTTGGKVYDIGRVWKPGFKVGLGADLGHDGWDMMAEYTWFKSSHSNSTPTVNAANLATNPVIYDSYWRVNQPVNGFTNILSSATSSWRLKMNVIDLEMGRNMYLSPRLTFRPHFGLKGTWQKQNLNVAMDRMAISATTINGVTVPATGAFRNTMANQMKNWGVGLRGGFDTAWHFTREFSLVGELALTGLWEEFKASRTDASVAAGSTTSVSNVNFSHHYHGLKPVVEWVLGLRYEFWTCGDDFHFGFEADWEGQEWFGQNKFLRLPGAEAVNGNDLGLQGLTVKARFDF